MPVFPGAIRLPEGGVTLFQRTAKVGLDGGRSQRGRISAATVPTLPKPDGHSRPLGEEEAHGILAARDRAGAIPPFRIGASVRLDAGENPIKFVMSPDPHRGGPSPPCIGPVRRSFRPPAVRSCRWSSRSGDAARPFRRPGPAMPSVPSAVPGGCIRRTLPSSRYVARCPGLRSVVIPPAQGGGF
ncbi:MAG: hypothetical protein FLDDKLPJ_03580 [Phycisphaerae bacterium]|nr:hypothetical protein [Phycisphaerae bacterium]